jgi:Outer membrane lipoprotein-sorting protein
MPSWRVCTIRALGLSCLAVAIAAIGTPAWAGTTDGAGAAATLEHFRRSVYAEPVYIEFDLREMPRRGEEHVSRGRLWGARNERGPIARLELSGGMGAPARALLVQGGPDPEVWVSDAGRGGTRDEAALMRPLVPGAEMTPFDLQMPYLYWLDVEFAGAARMRGRTADAYVFTPPAEFAATAPGVKSVRAYLDTQYGAFMQAEVAGADGRVAKTLSLLELRKVGERWIPRDLDVRNEVTRNKTRLSVTAVAVGIAIDPSTFEPSRLGAAAAPPADARLTRVAQ